MIMYFKGKENYHLSISKHLKNVGPGHSQVNIREFQCLWVNPVCFISEM